MTTTLRIEDGLKRECDAIFEDLGITLSGAVTMFLRQVVKQRAIPFALSCDRLPQFGYHPHNTMTIAERAEKANVASLLTKHHDSATARVMDAVYSGVVTPLLNNEILAE